MRIKPLCLHQGWKYTRITHTLWGDVKEVKCGNCGQRIVLELPKGLKGKGGIK